MRVLTGVLCDRFYVSKSDCSSNGGHHLVRTLSSDWCTTIRGTQLGLGLYMREYCHSKIMH